MSDKVERLASELLAAHDRAALIELPSARPGGLTVDEAYAVAARVAQLRKARGERPRGWKIGFTNRGIWDRYGVHAPIWGPVWDTTRRAARRQRNHGVARRPEPTEAGARGGLRLRARACRGHVAGAASRLPGLGGPRLRDRAHALRRLALHARRHGGRLRPAWPPLRRPPRAGGPLADAGRGPGGDAGRAAVRRRRPRTTASAASCSTARCTHCGSGSMRWPSRRRPGASCRASS